jgi:hypothetical protein
MSDRLLFTPEQRHAWEDTKARMFHRLDRLTALSSETVRNWHVVAVDGNGQVVPGVHLSAECPLLDAEERDLP